MEANSVAEAQTSIRYVQLDEEGYWSLQGVRLTDEEYGRELLQNLFIDERGVSFTISDGQPVIVEAFDEPLVARTIERTGTQFLLNFPYALQLPLDLSTLIVDEWDRFHGRTEKGVPFVLSRAAQAALFNLVDEFDDDSLTVEGQRYIMKPWIEPFTESEGNKFWTDIYENEQPGWELGRESVVLPEVLPQLKLPRSRVLVLGCGSGNDAAFFARAGHLVTGVDFSESAITRAKAQYGDVKDLRFLQHDVFALPSEWKGQFDVIFEHTCYCAIPPQRRTEFVQVWRHLLAERGHLLGVFFARDKRQGPPWGGSEWEIRHRLRGGFEFRYWTRWHRSIPKRQGYELVVWAQKK